MRNNNYNYKSSLPNILHAFVFVEYTGQGEDFKYWMFKIVITITLLKVGPWKGLLNFFIFIFPGWVAPLIRASSSYIKVTGLIIPSNSKSKNSPMNAWISERIITTLSN